MIPGINERLLTTKNDSAPALWITFRLRGAQEEVLQEEAGTKEAGTGSNQVSERRGDAWQETGRCAGGALVSLPPFAAVTINLDDLWATLDPRRRRGFGRRLATA